MNDEIFELDSEIWKLLMFEPVFSILARQFQRIETTSVPTAGVRMDNMQPVLMWNRSYLVGLSKEQRTGLLMHEFLHILLGHVWRPKLKEADKILANIAADLAVNSLISRSALHDSWVIPGEGHFAEYPKGESAEWYLEKLKEDKEKREQTQGEGACGSHEFWDSFLSDSEKEKLRQIVEQVVEQSSKNKSWGSIPEHLKKKLISSLSRTIDWKKVLSAFVKLTIRGEKYSSVKRINARFPYIHSGKNVRRYARVAISVDQSGSVSDEMLLKFFAELEGLLQVASFTLIPFDCSVCESEIRKYERGKTFKFERVACGGTDFSAPTKWVNENKFDGHIILTDLQADKPIPSRVRRLWITAKDCNKPDWLTELCVAI